MLLEASLHSQHQEVHDRLGHRILKQNTQCIDSDQHLLTLLTNQGANGRWRHDVKLPITILHHGIQMQNWTMQDNGEGGPACRLARTMSK